MTILKFLQDAAAQLRAHGSLTPLQIEIFEQGKIKIPSTAGEIDAIAMRLVIAGLEIGLVQDGTVPVNTNPLIIKAAQEPSNEEARAYLWEQGYFACSVSTESTVKHGC